MKIKIDKQDCMTTKQILTGVVTSSAFYYTYF